MSSCTFWVNWWAGGMGRHEDEFLLEMIEFALGPRTACDRAKRYW